MFKNQHRKLLFFGFLIFLGLLGALFFSNFILAQGSDWYRVTKNGGSETIDKHGICWIVINNRTDYDVFVPVKTLAEWQAFINSIQNESYPENVVLSPCVATCPVCHSGTPPSCVPETTNWGANLYGCEGFNKRCFEGDCKTCEEDDGITLGFIHGDGCIPSEGCAGQGGNACWRFKVLGGPVPVDYSCNQLCAFYHSCVQANWNESLTCDVYRALDPVSHANCLSSCETYKGWWGLPCCIDGTCPCLPPETDCTEHCCKTVSSYSLVPIGSFPQKVLMQMKGYRRDPSHDQDCGAWYECYKRFCVCQY